MKILTGASGFIGGSIAAHLARNGHHQVSGLIRRPEQADELKALGIEPVIGSLDDRALLIAQAKAADGVINAASSDHRGAVEALIEGLEGSNKPLLHTSGSSIVGDASGGEGSDAIYYEDKLPEPTADKAARVAIDNLVLDAAKRGVHASVLCNRPRRHDESEKRAVAAFAGAGEKKRRRTAYGTGTQYLVERAY